MTYNFALDLPGRFASERGAHRVKLCAAPRPAGQRGRYLGANMAQKERQSLERQRLRCGTRVLYFDELRVEDLSNRRKQGRASVRGSRTHAHRLMPGLEETGSSQRRVCTHARHRRLREQSASQQRASMGQEDKARCRDRLSNPPCGRNVSPKERFGIVRNGVASIRVKTGVPGFPPSRTWTWPPPQIAR